ncbi:MAG: orotidine-5'-phosphate decarboxylase [Exiguobacterium chiriqhucha]|jgi:orotidine-5'-phosphate decarboxylase|uniref:orotidine-5'-phosphate decarboxylase n=1 Tax=Exiguobacterium chiriqhucha TaxID=1385984 RepID=UPI00144E620F|nr:orotidine-5'-phosphate decarboxylase [Exiguobacterium chiriqhucha]KAB2864228.1 MAG: orotidine-5'-phosphate decarboxylase [Exiguobacterium chiriqhucha]
MNRLYLALDVETGADAFRLLERIEQKPAVKVGMELFYREGGRFVEQLVDSGYPVFLDVKVHDIPETARRTLRQIGRLGVELTNVHTLGGETMMRYALDGLRDVTDTTKLIGVTQLTSTDERMLAEELHIEGGLEQAVLRQATMADRAGLDGVVASVHEAHSIRQALGSSFLTVTPGIRMNETADDQVRIATPKAARDAGVSAIVVGRPITRAEDPNAAYAYYLQEWSRTYETNR